MVYRPIGLPMIMADGRLFYILGASGAGKDSLIQYVRQHIPDGAPIAYAHRYITRSADAGGENHIALSQREFALREKKGLFSMYWDSHQTRYGIGREIDLWMSQGLDVIVNGSRAYLEQAMSLYPRLFPIWIHVSPQTLRKRLIQRGRENGIEIKGRIEQAIRLDHIARNKGLEFIDNDRPLRESGSALIAILTKQTSTQCV